MCNLDEWKKNPFDFQYNINFFLLFIIFIIIIISVIAISYQCKRNAETFNRADFSLLNDPSRKWLIELIAKWSWFRFSQPILFIGSLCLLEIHTKEKPSDENIDKFLVFSHDKITFHWTKFKDSTELIPFSVQRGDIMKKKGLIFILVTTRTRTIISLTMIQQWI